MRCICVFAGSNQGVRAEYTQAAQDLGYTLVTHGFSLVYGGGSVGLMGTIADAVLARNGEAIGILPEGLFNREHAHEHLTRLYKVKSMHERKALMADLADAFIALPGGCGTFDELFEIITWAQIGLHTKPIGLLNVNGYYTPLLALLDHAIAEGFVKPEHRNLLVHKSTPDDLIHALITFSPPAETTEWADIPPER